MFTLEENCANKKVIAIYFSFSPRIFSLVIESGILSLQFKENASGWSVSFLIKITLININIR